MKNAFFANTLGCSLSPFEKQTFPSFNICHSFRFSSCAVSYIVQLFSSWVFPAQLMFTCFSAQCVGVALILEVLRGCIQHKICCQSHLQIHMESMSHYSAGQNAGLKTSMHMNRITEMLVGAFIGESTALLLCFQSQSRQLQGRQRSQSSYLALGKKVNEYFSFNHKLCY